MGLQVFQILPGQSLFYHQKAVFSLSTINNKSFKKFHRGKKEEAVWGGTWSTALPQASLGPELSALST